MNLANPIRCSECRNTATVRVHGEMYCEGCKPKGYPQKKLDLEVVFHAVQVNQPATVWLISRKVGMTKKNTRKFLQQMDNEGRVVQKSDGKYSIAGTD